MRDDKTMPDHELDGHRPGHWNLRWPMVIVVLALGVGLIVWGTSVGDDYWSSVLANGGVAVFLVVPLLLAERALARQVEQVREENTQQLGSIRDENDRAIGDIDSRLQEVQASVASVSEQLAHVTQSTASAVAQQRADDKATMLAPARAIAAEPSRDAVRTALRAADKAGAIQRWETKQGSWWGVHLAFPANDYAATVGVVDSRDPAPNLKIEFTVARNATFAHRLEWKIWWEPQQFFENTNAELRRLLGDQAPTVLPDVVLGALAGAIEVALTRRSAVGQLNQWSLIGAVGSWIVSTEGLEHTERGVLASIEEMRAATTEPPIPDSAPDRGELVTAWPRIQRWLRQDDGIVALWR